MAAISKSLKCVDINATIINIYLTSIGTISSNHDVFKCNIVVNKARTMEFTEASDNIADNNNTIGFAEATISIAYHSEEVTYKKWHYDVVIESILVAIDHIDQSPVVGFYIRDAYSCMRSLIHQ